MKRSALATAVGVALIAAAPPAAAPQIFAGAAGWEAVPGGTRATSGSIVEGSVIAEQRVAYARTGVLRQELRGGSAFSRYAIPAGTHVYAVPLKGFGVAWCIPGSYPDSAGDQSGKRKKERCLFWQDGRLVSTDAYDTKSPFASVAVTGVYYMSGELQIDEQPISLDQTFRIVVTLGKVFPDRLRIDFWFDDGRTRTFLTSGMAGRDPDGVVPFILWGGQALLQPSSSNAFELHVVQPLRDVLENQDILTGVRHLESASNVQVLRL